MRLFVALEIPAAVREKLAALMDELRAAEGIPGKNRARWVPAENLHVTLKFIGNVEGGNVEAIRGALAGVRGNGELALRFRGLGFFPNEKRPRVLWAGIEGTPKLGFLAGEIEAGLEKLGIPRETREFSPHLTLTRFDPPGIVEALRGAVQKNASREIGEMRTSEFHLFESKTRPTGAEYTRLSSFSTAKAEG